MRGKHAAPNPPDLEGRLPSNFLLGMTGILAAWALVLTLLTVMGDVEPDAVIEYSAQTASAVDWPPTVVITRATR